VARATIQDVADRAGVSVSTVSAVLNDKATVKETTRAQVLAVMRELNYRPRPALRRPVASRKTRSAVFVLRDVGNPYYTEVIAGVEDVLRERGYRVLTAASHGVGSREREIVDTLREMDIDGLLLTPVLDREADLSHLFDLRRRNIRFVLLEDVLGLQASLVDVDTVDGSKKAVEHLIALGHSRIAHFAGPAYSRHTHERLAGVRAAYAESALVFSDALVTTAGDSMHGGYQAGLAYFGGRAAADRPTAVTCYNDLVAIGLCRALGELGLRVPDDVSVVGYDDVPLLEFLTPRLTSVRVPTREIGRVAAEILHEEIEGGPPESPRRVYLRAELVIRDSTRAPGAT
jgi:LacI family transcriptional regulator/LacI family repressor for deo operon, udp, cdd, tsx, nupC, and nupG